jgi:hypothetical protein
LAMSVFGLGFAWAASLFNGYLCRNFQQVWSLRLKISYENESKVTAT